MVMRSALVLAAFALALAGSGAARSAISTANSETVVKVTAKDYSFVLSQDGSSRPHRVLDQERGKTSHDFGIAGHTSKTVQPGKSTTIAVTLKPGRYPYKCTVDSH